MQILLLHPNLSACGPVNKKPIVSYTAPSTTSQKGKATVLEYGHKDIVEVF